MAEPYIGQIDMFAFDRAPKNYALCNGQILSIAQNQALFTLLGTMYGGNGVSTFGLPDLRGRIGIGFNATYSQGSNGGETAHTLSGQEIPAHTHTLNANASTAATVDVPNNNVVLGQSNGKLKSGAQFTLNIYNTAAPTGSLAPASLGGGGAGQSHPNMMPYQVISFCIALQGIYPSRN